MISTFAFVRTPDESNAAADFANGDGRLGAVLFALAVVALHRVGRVIEVGLQIASVAYGALLGVFLLGVLTKRANQNGAIVGMICGFATELYLWKFSHVPLTWWVAIGTVVTFSVGYASSLVFHTPAAKS